MPIEDPLPRYRFRSGTPSLLEMVRKSVSDTAAIIPDAILTERTVQLPSPPFGPPGPLIVADPEIARLVLLDRAEQFGRTPLMKRLLRRSWGDGLAGAEGQSWRNQRRAASPAFRPQSVAAHTVTFARVAREVVNGLPRGADLDLAEVAGRVVSKILFRTLVAADDIIDPDSVAREMPAYVHQLSRFGFADLAPIPETWHDRMWGGDTNECVKRVKGMAATIAANKTRNDEQPDLVDLLAAAGPVEDNIRGLLPAAMDTTVKAVAWTLFVLSRRPEWQDRVAAEARACFPRRDLEQLSLTRRVVQETLRLFPPAPMLVRIALRNMELDGRRIRVGQTVVVSVYALHRNQSLWERPDEFQPDRFLTGQGPHPGFMPFGLGSRSCVAAQFALSEITVVIAEMVSAIVLISAGCSPQISLQVSTHPETPLLAICNDRPV